MVSLYGGPLVGGLDELQPSVLVDLNAWCKYCNMIFCVQLHINLNFA